MTVYLIHLSHPLGDPNNPHGQAKHYLGSAKDLQARLAHHRAGTGAKLLRAANNLGISWEVVRTWDCDDDRALERQLKGRKKHRCLCPICSAKEAANG